MIYTLHFRPHQSTLYDVVVGSVVPATVPVGHDDIHAGKASGTGPSPKRPVDRKDPEWREALGTDDVDIVIRMLLLDWRHRTGETTLARWSMEWGTRMCARLSGAIKGQGIKWTRDFRVGEKGAYVAPGTREMDWGGIVIWRNALQTKRGSRGRRAREMESAGRSVSLEVLSTMGAGGRRFSPSSAFTLARLEEPLWPYCPPAARTAVGPG